MSPLQRFVCSVMILLLLLTSELRAQTVSASVATIGVSNRSTVEAGGDEFEDPLGRTEYYRFRNASPFGIVPEGAYARAAKYAHDEMPRFIPNHAGTQSVASWHSIGPVNIGGRINALAVNPINPNTIFIGASDGGVWKTEDEGLTWRSVFDNAPTQLIGALAVDPKDTNVIYAGTGDADAGDGYGLGIFKSTNNGATWFEVADTTFPKSSLVHSIVVDPFVSSTIYATVPLLNGGVQGGLYKSTNSGVTWTLLLKGIIFDLLVNPSTAGTLVAAASGTFGDASRSASWGVMRSMNGGVSWRRDSLPGFDSLKFGRASLAQCAAHPEVIYAAVSEMANARTRMRGIYKTTNNGAVWTQLSLPIDYLVPQGWYDNVLLTHPTDPNRVIAFGVRLIRTTDGGANWGYIPVQYYNAGLVHSDQHAVAYNPLHPDTVYLGDDGGFFRGTAWGGDWNKRTKGLEITQFVGGAMYPGSDVFRLGGTQDNMTMQSIGSSSFDQTLGGDGGYTAVHPQHPQTIYSEMYYLSLYRSDDLGGTWKRITNGIPAGEQTLFYAPYALASHDGNTMYYGSTEIFKSTNRGDSWKTLNSTSCLFSAGFNGCYYVSVVAVSPFNDSVVFAASTNGAVARSTNAGTSWKALGTGLPARWISSVRTTSNGAVYCTMTGFGGGHVYKLNADSTRWANISSNLPDIPMNDVFVYGDTIVVGTLLGAYITTNGGGSWSVYASGMPAVSIVQLLFNSNSGTLRAVTHGRGMYDITFIDIPQSAPAFRSVPDTADILPGQPFVYAPIVVGSPQATFSILSSDGTAVIDSALGIVRWKRQSGAETITITARNSVGSSKQTFSIRVQPVTGRYDWSIVSNVQTGRRTASLAVIAPSTLWMTQDSCVVAHSIDGGATWIRQTLADTLGFATGLAALDASTVLVGTWGGNLFRTSDAGGTWTSVYFAPNKRWENIAFADLMNGMAVCNGERDTVFVIITHDGGKTWTPQPSHVFGYRPVPHTLCMIDPRHVWFASSNRESSPATTGTIYGTTNGGQLWSAVGSHCVEVGAIAFVDSMLGYAVDMVGGVVDKSTDGGKTWIQTTAPMSGSDMINVTSIRGTAHLWVVSSTNAWYSNDEGNHWIATNVVPMGPAVAAAFIDSSRGWIAGMNNVVQLHSQNPPVFVNEFLIPRSTGGDAFPNPFARTTRLVFNVGSTYPARIRLEIVDKLGRTVRDLTEEASHDETGKITALFDGSHLPVGAYTAILQVAEQLYTQPLLIVR